MPILLYGLESCQLSDGDLHSLDFTYNRMCMKLFKSSNIELIKEYQGYFHCLLPSLNVKERCQKFVSKYGKGKGKGLDQSCTTLDPTRGSGRVGSGQKIYRKRRVGSGRVQFGQRPKFNFKVP